MTFRGLTTTTVVSFALAKAQDALAATTTCKIKNGKRVCQNKTKANLPKWAIILIVVAFLGIFVLVAVLGFLQKRKKSKAAAMTGPPQDGGVAYAQTGNSSYAPVATHDNPYETAPMQGGQNNNGYNGYLEANNMNPHFTPPPQNPANYGHPNYNMPPPQSMYPPQGPPPPQTGGSAADYYNGK